MFVAVQLLIVKFAALPQLVHLVYGHPTTVRCLQLCSYLQSNLQLCRSLYTWCTEIPQLWDVENVMWNILIQTACSYTYEKYFKQLIKDYQVAICLQLCSYLQSNLQLCRSLYTWCTENPQLWDVESHVEHFDPNGLFVHHREIF